MGVGVVCSMLGIGICAYNMGVMCMGVGVCVCACRGVCVGVALHACLSTY